MSKATRITELTDKLLGGNITAEEAAELDRLDTDDVEFIYTEGKATEAQKDYIETLLGKLGANTDEYVDGGELDDLTFDDASELIDRLKDDVTADDAWDD